MEQVNELLELKPEFNTGEKVEYKIEEIKNSIFYMTKAID